MIIRSWRLTKEKHLRSAFSGEGARQFGGRWNSPGQLMVYTAGSQALAVLELLVHLESRRILESYAFVAVEFDDSIVTKLDAAGLPAEWRSEPSPATVQAIGDDWLASSSSAVLQVPSVQVPSEWNYLLNPRHKDFSRIRLGDPVPFSFDPRLGTRE